MLRWIFLAFVLCAGQAWAQGQTAQPVTPGYLTTVGCPSSALTPCFVPYGPSGGPGGSVTQGTSPWVTSDNGTKITAATMPAGGAGITGWLSAIWYQLTQTLTVGGSVTASGSVSNANDAAQGAATSGLVGPLVQSATTTAAPTYTTGTTNPLSSDVAGRIRVGITSGTGGSATAAIVGAAADGGSATLTAGLWVNSQTIYFNGTTLERGVTCTQTAPVSVTAGNTTQIVGLSGTTLIRVCSFSLGASIPGTAQWITGTGTNCGTPTTITAAMPVNETYSWSLAAGGGSTLFRGTAGGELCLAAVTGNVTGFVTYAQY